jgi:hypothetical protein
VSSAADEADIIDRIYEAAAFGDLWPTVMEEVSEAVDAHAACMLVRTADAWTGLAPSPSIDEAVRAYAETDIPLRTSTTARLIGANRPGFVTDEDLFSPEEYQADPYIAEWAMPQGLYHGAASAIHVPTGDFAVVQIHRRLGAPPFDPDTVALLDALRPHLARSAALAARWRLERLRVAVEAMDLLGLPAAVLNASGRVLLANSLLENRKDLVTWRPGDRLALHQKAGNDLLQQAVSELADASAAARHRHPPVPERWAGRRPPDTPARGCPRPVWRRPGAPDHHRAGRAGLAKRRHPSGPVRPHGRRGAGGGRRIGRPND